MKKVGWFANGCSTGETGCVRRLRTGPFRFMVSLANEMCGSELTLSGGIGYSRHKP